MYTHIRTCIDRKTKVFHVRQTEALATDYIFVSHWLLAIYCKHETLLGSGTGVLTC